ncbi:MAG: hypothetical protein M3M87_07150 [Thermoproteota archaeon]|nr:hypothetical protein [Thermoproteota archaeon]
MTPPADNHKNLIDSSRYEEKTQVIYGKENVEKWALQMLDTAKKTLDLLGDRYGPSMIVAHQQILQKYIELYKRGVRQRFITEITKDNIEDCKKLMKFQELRHLDGLKGYLAIMDGRILTSHAFSQQYELPHAVESNVRVFVEQQQYFFETLWGKAIPARQRMKELEKGAKREFVETIRDPSEIQKLSFDLIKAAEEEILLLFSTVNVFRRYERAGMLKLLKEAALHPRNVKIRILIPAEEEEKKEDTNRMRGAAATKYSTTTTMTTTNETMQHLKELGIDVRRTSWQLRQHQNFLRNNNLTLLIVDQSFSLTVELNDNEEDNIKQQPSEDQGEGDPGIGLATYSNSDSTVFAYTSIFENLWMQTEL